MATRISNAELGELIGVSHSMASRIRGGQRLPSVRTIREIHREFDVPLPELVDAHCSGRKAFAKLMEGILQERGEAQAV